MVRIDLEEGEDGWEGGGGGAYEGYVSRGVIEMDRGYVDVCYGDVGLG